MWVFRSFPQENEKNNREPLICVKLISGSLNALFQDRQRLLERSPSTVCIQKLV